MTEQFRIKDKSGVNRNGPCCCFKLFERQGNAFFFAGTYFRPGKRIATDQECIDYALREREETESFAAYNEHEQFPS